MRRKRRTFPAGSLFALLAVLGCSLSEKPPSASDIAKAHQCALDFAQAKGLAPQWTIEPIRAVIDSAKVDEAQGPSAEAACDFLTNTIFLRPNWRWKSFYHEFWHLDAVDTDEGRCQEFAAWVVPD
jgi:hypothetical protein